MTLIDLRFSLEVDPACGRNAEIRAWIDLQPEVGLGSEIELPLRRTGKREWIGTFGLGRAGLPYFLYRIGIAAHEGAAWELTIRQRGGGVLIHDADVSTLAKSWLVGNCDIPLPRELQSATGNDSARAAAGNLLGGGPSRLGTVRYLRLERFEPAQDGKSQHDRTRNPTE